MKNIFVGTRSKVILTFALLILLMLTVSPTIAPASAQSGGGYDLTWNVIADGGAASSVGGSYSLAGTIGQADAGAVSGGAYALVGGFWSGWQNVVSYSLHLFLPLVQNGQ